MNIFEVIGCRFSKANAEGLHRIFKLLNPLRKERGKRNLHEFKKIRNYKKLKKKFKKEKVGTPVAPVIIIS